MLGKPPVPGRPNSDKKWQRPIVLAVCAGGVCLNIRLFRLTFLCSFSLSGKRPDTD